MNAEWLSLADMGDRLGFKPGGSGFRTLVNRHHELHTRIARRRIPGSDSWEYNVTFVEAFYRSRPGKGNRTTGSKRTRKSTVRTVED